MRTIIKGGQVHNGKQFLGVCDILIENDRIREIGNLDAIHADEIVEANSFIVCPGFIDVQNMTYSIDSLESNDAINLTSQGVTSCVIGNCGNSGDLDAEDSLIKRIDYLKRAKLGINVGMLVGHNSLRRLVLKNGERISTKDEVKQMISILGETLQHGALGMSTGLVYSPGIFADKAEIIGLVESIGKLNKVYTTHLRDEGENVIGAVNEALETAKNASAKLVISHFKINGEKNWKKWDQVLSQFEHGRATLDFHVDFYPYTSTSTFLNILLLPEILEKIKGDFNLLSYNSFDENLVEATGKQNLASNRWHDVVIVSSTVPNTIGKSIDTLANGASCYSVVVDILRQDPKTRAVFHNITSEEQIVNVAKLPYSMVVTDGYIYSSASTVATHPRNYGAFPRVLNRYVSNGNLITLDEFIKKSTYLPSTVFNIKERGLLEIGNFADVIVFEPEKVIDTANYENPCSLSVGMKYIYVNGKLVLKDNIPTKAYPGSLLT